MGRLSKKNILLTGGAGFIGSNFCHFVINKGFDGQLVILDNLTYAGDIKNLYPLLLRENVHFFKGDISDESVVARLFEHFEFDLVLNFAAESHVDRSINSASSFVESNIKGVLVLLQHALKFWEGDFENKLFFQVSTDEVYGALDENDASFSELSVFKPNSPYSASKAGAEHLVRAWNQTYGLPTVITNCSNNYGPYQHFEKLIPLIVKCLYCGEKVPIYGDGLQRRDWLHVYDHCTAIYLLISEGVLGESYCIGSGYEYTNLDVVRAIYKVFLSRRSSNANRLPFESIVSHVADRLGHDRRYAINSEKIRRLGWKPVYNFGDGIHEVASWYLDNTDRIS